MIVRIGENDASADRRVKIRTRLFQREEIDLGSVASIITGIVGVVRAAVTEAIAASLISGIVGVIAVAVNAGNAAGLVHRTAAGSDRRANTHVPR